MRKNLGDRFLGTGLSDIQTYRQKDNKMNLKRVQIVASILGLKTLRSTTIYQNNTVHRGHTSVQTTLKNSRN